MDDEEVLPVWTGRLMLAAVGCIATIGAYLHWFVPFERSIQIMDGAVAGIAAGLLSIYLLAIFWTHRRQWTQAGLMNAVGTTLVIGYAVWARGWWFLWRLWERPDWMREQQVLPLTALLCGLLLMFGAAVTDKEGRILPLSWVIAIASIATGIAAGAVAIALLK
ncbi:hypothetical protein sos41_12020 [Alphaproteobacteria bacterium SO-S41]|nr:hypothetical protein sos41_12020 [Alphaproteobacteria bacterium SO-S41]